MGTDVRLRQVGALNHAAGPSTRKLSHPSLSEAVDDLARRFRVSGEAMTYRLTNLGMLDPYSLAG